MHNNVICIRWTCRQQINCGSKIEVVLGSHFKTLLGREKILVISIFFFLFPTTFSRGFLHRAIKSCLCEQEFGRHHTIPCLTTLNKRAVENIVEEEKKMQQHFLLLSLCLPPFQSYMSTFGSHSIYMGASKIFQKS